MRTDREPGTLRRLACLALVAASLACSQPPGANNVGVVLVSDSSEAITDFAVLVRYPDGKEEMHCCGLACPESEPCAGSAIGLPELDPQWVDPLVFQIRARGHRFRFNRSISPEEFQAAGGKPVEIVLEALEPFADTADYATGFSPDGLDHFIAMSVALATLSGPSQVVKFYIQNLGGETPTVYFQDTVKHPLHYYFVTGVLGIPIAHTEFFQETYVGEGRHAMAGAVAYHPDVSTGSCSAGEKGRGILALTFFPSDNLSPSLALKGYQLIEERLGFASFAGNRMRLLYVPAGLVQEEQLLESPGVFEESGSCATLLADIFQGTHVQVLSPGTSYGILALPSGRADTAQADSSGEILVSGAGPAGASPCGLVLTAHSSPLEPAVQALKSAGLPAVALPDKASGIDLDALLGTPVMLQGNAKGFTLEEATAAQVEEFRKQLPVTEAPAPDLESDELAWLEQLGLEDSPRVGLAGACLGEVASHFDALAPSGFVIPYRHYYDHLQTVLSAELCAGFSDYAALDALPEGPTLLNICTDASMAGDSLGELLFGLLADERMAQAPDFRAAALMLVRLLITNAPVSAGLELKLDDALAQMNSDHLRVRLSAVTATRDRPGYPPWSGFVDIDSDASALSDAVRESWALAWTAQAHDFRTLTGFPHLATTVAVLVTAAREPGFTGVLATQNLANPAVTGMFVSLALDEGPGSPWSPDADLFSIVAAPSGMVQQAVYRQANAEPLLGDPALFQLFTKAQAIQNHLAGRFKADPFQFALSIVFTYNISMETLVIEEVTPYPW